VDEGVVSGERWRDSMSDVVREVGLIVGVRGGEGDEFRVLLVSHSDTMLTSALVLQYPAGREKIKR
jgi:hypothetical protein